MQRKRGIIETSPKDTFLFKREIADVIDIFNRNKINGMRIKYFKKGETLFFMGEVTEYVYFILTERVLLLRVLRDGKLFGNILKCGHFVGEYLDDEELAEVVAMDDLLALEIPKQVFVNKLMRIPEFQRVILENDAKRRKLEAKALNWICFNHNAKLKVAKALYHFAKYIFYENEKDGVITIPLSRRMFGNIVNLERETVCRIIKNLADEGIVVNRRKCKILIRAKRLEDLNHYYSC
jgi:CRP-like cAMP-binding protein